MMSTKYLPRKKQKLKRRRTNRAIGANQELGDAWPFITTVGKSHTLPKQTRNQDVDEDDTASNKQLVP